MAEDREGPGEDGLVSGKRGREEEEEGETTRSSPLPYVPLWVAT